MYFNATLQKKKKKKNLDRTNMGVYCTCTFFNEPRKKQVNM